MNFTLRLRVEGHAYVANRLQIWPLEVLRLIHFVNKLTVFVASKGPTQRCPTAKYCTQGNGVPMFFQHGTQLNRSGFDILTHLLFDQRLDFSHYFGGATWARSSGNATSFLVLLQELGNPYSGLHKVRPPPVNDKLLVAWSPEGCGSVLAATCTHCKPFFLIWTLSHLSEATILAPSSMHSHHTVHVELIY